MKLSAVLLALLISGCVDGTPPSSTLVRDSSGVAIVESVGPYRGQNVPDVGSTVLRVGQDPKPGHDFYRVVGATVLAGDLIVADAGSGEIRRFDREGELVDVVGGLGDGPGEYASLGWMGRYADSLLAWDRGADRFTVYDRDLRIARTYLGGVPSSSAPSQVVRGVLADGRVIRSTGESFVPPIASPGIVRPPLSSYLQAPTGEIVASLGPFLGTQISVHSSERTGRLVRLPVPLGDRTIMAVGADKLLVADSESLEVKVLSGGQVLVRIYRPNLDPRPASESDTRAEIERLIEPIPSDGLREAMRREFESMPMPGNLPWLSALAVDADGHVWLQPAESSEDWAYLTPTGGLVGWFRVPEGEILDVGADYLLLLRRDELGVETVDWRAIHR